MKTNDFVRRVVATLFATITFLFGFTAAQAQTQLAMVDFMLTEDGANTARCPTTGCRFLPLPVGWKVPNDLWANYPQATRNAVPTQEGVAVLDFWAQSPGMLFRRSGVQFYAYRDGTPGTFRMHKGMISPEYPRIGGIISHVYFPQGTMLGNELAIDYLLREQAGHYVEEGFGGWSVAIPAMLPDSSLPCRTGETFLFKVYNDGVNKPATGGRNDGNHRYVTNQMKLRNQTSTPGWASGYADDVYCVPEQVSDVVVGHFGAGVTVSPGEGNGRFNYITRVNVGGSAPPVNVLSSVRPQYRIGYNPSTDTIVWGQGFNRAQAKSMTVVEVGRPGSGIVSSQFDESADQIYYLYDNQAAFLPDSPNPQFSMMLWRENGSEAPNFSVQLSTLGKPVPGQRRENAIDMVLFIRPYKIGGKVAWKRFAVVSLGSYLLSATGSVAGEYQGRVLLVNLNGASPVVDREFQLSFHPRQIALDETTGVLHMTGYRYMAGTLVASVNLFTGAQTEIPWTFPGESSGLVVDNKLGRLYVSGEKIDASPDMSFDRVYVRDLLSNAWVDQVGIEVGHSPRFLEVGSRDGVNFVYAANTGKRERFNDLAIYPGVDWGIHEINPATLATRRVETGEQAPLGLVAAPQH